MLNIDRLWRAAVGYLPILATVATLAPLSGLVNAGVGPVVLGVAVCLSLRRSAGEHARLSTVAGRVLAATIGVGLLGAAFSVSLVAGDIVFLCGLLFSRLAGHYGPRWSALGRSMLLPLTALFIAPPVSVGQHRPLWSLGVAAAACLVATGWTALIGRLLPRPGPGLYAVRRATRRAVRRPLAAGSSRADGRGRALTTAALVLDGKLVGDEPARRSLAHLEYTVDRFRSGQAPESDVDVALAGLGRAVADHHPDPAHQEPPAAAAAPSSSARTRLAWQSTIAVALAFILGQALFPQHWPWAAVTVIAVSLAARSSGDVLLRSAQRLGGAALATVVATPVASALAHQRPALVAVILVILGVGTYLRERSYVWWAMAVTASLALLYGLLGQTGDTSLLWQRLLAICLGAACAIGPALLLAPKTSALVRRRTATCLTQLRVALDGDPMDVAAVRGFDAALAELRTGAAPLLAIRRFRSGAEVGWLEMLTDCAPGLRMLVIEPDRATWKRLRRTLGSVAAEVRARSSRAAAPAAPPRLSSWAGSTRSRRPARPPGPGRGDRVS
jgi:Fusaric acid resistance protein-like